MRGERTGPEVARMALGDVPWKKLRDFANYLSKIENDKVPNVGLRYLRLLAAGYGHSTLTSFFAQIEGLPEPVGLSNDRTSPTQASAADEAVPTITPREADIAIRVLTKVVAQQADEREEAREREAERERGAHRRHATTPRREETAPNPDAGKHHPRHARRRVKRRQPKR
jgi:transcriptional regulator with XRE-family HTH domain